MRLDHRPALNRTAKQLRLAGASAVALTVALLGAGAAFAQDKPASSDKASQVGEVVVTG